jgi:hypothetical protein
MTEMSSFLRQLEEIINPPKNVILATKINKVLKAIKQLDDIPRECELQLKRRATNLLEKWKGILEYEEQPDTFSIQRPSETASQTLVIDLTESYQPVTGSEVSRQPTSQHGNEHSPVQGVETTRTLSQSSTSECPCTSHSLI